MPTTIELKYGRTSIPFEYGEEWAVLDVSNEKPPLTDAEIGARLDSPIDSDPIEDTVRPGETVLIVVPDATRQVGCGQVVNLLVRRHIAAGVNAFDIRIIFATGIHRKVTDDEKSSILTPFIARRIKTLDHDARDLMQLTQLGHTSGGIPIELNRALVEHDHVILVGGVSFHYFAGFTGSRKLICPGLASSRTIAGTHKLAFDIEAMTWRQGVGTGLLDGNAVHEAFLEAASVIKPSFSISTIVNDLGEPVDLFCGDWIASHQAACDVFARDHVVEIGEKRDVVVASCGGFPNDINMIQAHKSLEVASHACNDGGTIILLAECADGLGRADFLKWFDVANSDELALRLCDRYEVNGQTAWSLLKKTERINVRLVTKLDADAAARMRLLPAFSLSSAIREAAPGSSGFIIPNAAKMVIRSV